MANIQWSKYLDVEKGPLSLGMHAHYMKEARASLSISNPEITMAKSTVYKTNFWDQPTPAQMKGCCLCAITKDSKMECFVSHIGRNVFVSTPSVTRSYVLDRWKDVHAYMQAIVRKYLENGFDAAYWEHPGTEAPLFVIVQSAAASPRPFLFRKDVWMDAEWLGMPPPLSFNPAASGSDEAMLMTALSAGLPDPAGATPSPDVPIPHPRGAESAGVPNDKIAPHRRSVIKGMRDPATYLEALLKG